MFKTIIARTVCAAAVLSLGMSVAEPVNDFETLAIAIY